MIGLTGTISAPVVFSHSVSDQQFFRTVLAVKRLSGTVDSLPLILPERKIKILDLTVGQRISVRGQIRSYNRHVGGKNHLILSVYVEELTSADENSQDFNELRLRGFICKTPVLRMTPLGRKACDLLVAASRAYGRSDYLPVIAWGKTAVKASAFSVGTQIEGIGRMQSRTYTKRFPDGSSEERTAYEVSLMRADVVDTAGKEE